MAGTRSAARSVMIVRFTLMAAGATAVAGCTTTMRDYFRAKPLSAIPLHHGMDHKEQCMHCHTAGIAGAPAVPHPEYKRCVLCHKTTAAE